LKAHRLAEIPWQVAREGVSVKLLAEGAVLCAIAESKELAETTAPPPLQDFVASQHPLLLGLIAQLLDSPLQAVVEPAARRLLQKGQSILAMRFGRKTKGITYADHETSPVRAAASPSSAAVHLGGSASGAAALHPKL
jgi:hypothetical protein